MDSYRPPKSRQNIYSMPPPPAPPDMPPFSVRKEFSFRNQDSAPQYPQGGDRYRPQSSLREDNLPRRKKKHQGGRARREAREAAANRRFWGPRIATAERPLLTARGDHNPEHIGFDTRRFMPADDLSDSDEEDMEESDIDDGLQWNDGATDNPTQNGHMDDLSSLKVDDDTIEPPTKRRALVSVAKVNEEPDIPKWSNPDPYTVLPPVDESQRKRKDVVKIIRKARISTDKAMGAESQVVTNDDFISLGFDKGTSSNDLNHSSSPSDFESGKDEPGVPGAPTGPRSFRHLTNLYGRNDSCAPGASTPALSVGTLGPPPGLSNGYDATSKQRLARSDSYPDQMAALGSRKRTHDDQIKDDNGQKPKPKPLRQASNGSLLHEWVPRGVNEATPWLRDDHRSTKDPGHRLHKEVCDFYDFVRPQDFEQVVREALLQRLQAAVSEEYPGYNVYCFGSFAAGMYLPNADMDLVIISQSFRKMGERVAFQYQHQMRTFGNFLERSELAEQGSLQVIFSAKVPLVKYVDRLTGILVDVSFENNTGLIANDTFNAWKLQFPAMPILATLIKQFLLMRGLNEVNLPRVQAGEVIPEQHLGEMLLEFFDLYGNSFDITRTGISMNPPGYYNKHEVNRYENHQPIYHGNKAYRLAILDPNRIENDISGGSKNVGLIFDHFSQAHEEILKAMRLPNKLSLLDWVLGGDYDNFTSQRDRLRKLYEQGSSDSNNLELHTRQLPHSTNSIDLKHVKLPLSELPQDIFVNPVNPNVVIQPMVKRKKASRRKRLQSRNQNIDPLPQAVTPVGQQSNTPKMKKSKKFKSGSSNTIQQIT